MFIQMVLGQLSTCKEMKLGPFFKTYIKINLKWTTDLNVRAKTMELLEENTGVNLHDLGQAMVHRHDTKMTSDKEKTDKLDFIKIRNLALQSTKEVRRQTAAWELISASQYI